MAEHANLKDPRNLYPQPPFAQQPQTSPGLAKDMEPRPDHGEKSYKGSGLLSGRKALITGGDSGIGRAVAIAYAREGADIAFSYLSSEKDDAREVQELIEAEGRRVVPIAGDITDEETARGMVREAADKLGGLDLLVVNAGHQQFREKIEDLSSEDFDRTMKTNLYALHWITQTAIPYMQPGSSIITTASVQGYNPSPILLDYATTKAGIVAYTQALAKQVIDRGIRANVVAPGPFWTALQPAGGQPQEALVQFGGKTVIGRPGQPAEIAPVYVLLASAAASYITGEVYGVTGGSAVV